MEHIRRSSLLWRLLLSRGSWPRSLTENHRTILPTRVVVWVLDWSLLIAGAQHSCLFDSLFLGLRSFPCSPRSSPPLLSCHCGTRLETIVICLVSAQRSRVLRLIQEMRALLPHHLMRINEKKPKKKTRKKKWYIKCVSCWCLKVSVVEKRIPVGM